MIPFLGALFHLLDGSSVIAIPHESGYLKLSFAKEYIMPEESNM